MGFHSVVRAFGATLSTRSGAQSAPFMPARKPCEFTNTHRTRITSSMISVDNISLASSGSYTVSSTIYHTIPQLCTSFLSRAEFCEASLKDLVMRSSSPVKECAQNAGWANQHEVTITAKNLSIRD
jgi:hypothetical protein